MLCFIHCPLGNLSMTAKQTGRCKFSKPVTHHGFIDKYLDKSPAGVDSKPMPHKLRRDLTRARPRFDGRFVTTCFLLLHFDQKLFVYIRTFFTASGHAYFLLCKINRLLYFLRLRVFLPSVLLPQGLLGDFIPIPLRPSPPP